MKILIADDQLTNLKLIERSIANLDFEKQIFLCQDPFQIISTMIKEKIDILLLDIRMPGKSGIEILQEIRETKELTDVQVLMITALTDNEILKTCFELGARDYIKKPVNNIEMQARIKAAANSRKNLSMINEINEKLTLQNQELMNLNQVLKETQFHMIQNEKMASIGELAAGVAHEINNPLGFIESNLETLDNFSRKIKNVIQIYRNLIPKIQEKVKLNHEDLNLFELIYQAEEMYKLDFVMDEFTDTIKDSKDGIDRVAKIVQTLKNFARTGLDEDIALNDINMIMDEVLLIVKNEAKYQIDIIKQYGDIKEVMCNKGQIEQVFLNILMNAVQAIKSENRQDRGSIIIYTSESENSVSIVIRDDGPGIPEEIRNKIFDPFFTTKEVGEGTGLGLSISHDIIVNKHGGLIWAESNDRKGTSMHIKIPYIKGEKGNDKKDIIR